MEFRERIFIIVIFENYSSYREIFTIFDAIKG